MEVITTLKWYEFNQNNSGGSFHCDDKVCHCVWIEAETERMAIARAEDLGIYFDGCNDGRDCGCCGDRWSKPWDAKKFPIWYFNKKEDGVKPDFLCIEDYTQYMADNYGWTDPDVRLYYANGDVKEIKDRKRILLNGIKDGSIPDPKRTISEFVYADENMVIAAFYPDPWQSIPREDREHGVLTKDGWQFYANRKEAMNIMPKNLEHKDG